MEYHLHPRAQAAFISFLVDQTDGSDQNYVVETHSDQIIDRLRIESRRRKLDPSAFSLLYFEHGDDGARIYQIKMDDMGNLTKAPTSCRNLFLHEEYVVLGIDS